METLFDTSVIVSGIVESHPMHSDKLLRLNVDDFRHVWPEGKQVIFTP
jgi:hypothetical protein